MKVFLRLLVLNLLLVSSCLGEEFSMVKLPEPKYSGKISVEEALKLRRSVREYSGKPLSLEEVSQLLWASQGVTSPKGFRTAPSAGALYPLEVYVVIGDVKDFPKGVYKYRPSDHSLYKVKDGDVREELSKAALGQSWVRDGAVVIVFSAEYDRTTRVYGQRGIRYVHIEVGHASENLHLQAVSLSLGTVVVGAFRDDEVKKILSLPPKEEPLVIMPVGRLE